MRGAPWSNDRIELVKRLWEAGASAQTIAGRLDGVSRSAVLGKIFRLRLKPRAPARRRRGGKSGAASADAAASRRRRGKSLAELTNASCRWPRGHPGTATFSFCGAPGANLERGIPYCAGHARRAYLAGRI